MVPEWGHLQKLLHEQPLSPHPKCWAEGTPPPGRIPRCHANLELRRASVKRSVGWRGSTSLEVAFPGSVLQAGSAAGVEMGWELKVPQTLVPGSLVPPEGSVQR